MQSTIKEYTVRKGDLILLMNKDKPTKSGWWRKGSSCEEIIYVLEKPIHKDFDLNRVEIANSRIENGLCVMKENTLNYGQKILNKFIILAKSGAISQQHIMHNNYMLGVDKEKLEEIKLYDDFVISEDGNKFFDLYFDKDEDFDGIKDLVKNIVE